MSDSTDNGELTRQFAWGVAHDFSNLVQVILGFAEFLTTQHVEDAELQQCVTEIITASGRARELVTQLRLIGHRYEPVLEPTDLNTVLQDLAAELQTLVGPRIRLAWRLQPDGGRIPLDRACVKRAVTTLCAFARDAMPEGGTLTIATHLVHSGDVSASAHPALKPGGYVRVSVRDTGPGYEPAAAERLCEPFYMKRTMGLGHGLELAVARGVAEQHEGALAIDTSPGRGMTVHLYFPCAAA